MKLKRAFDFVVAVSILIVAMPLLVLLFLIVRFQMGRPVIFVQERVGFENKVFRIYKLRTMRNTPGSNGKALPDRFRLTPLGRFLRATSLDELPSMWNVVRGELTFVGPRPLLPEYLSLYSERHLRRHSVMPGITGWAQINGRNAISWQERLDLDVWYVENRSLFLDCYILLQTVKKVIEREGISSGVHATMPPFTGSKSD